MATLFSCDDVASVAPPRAGAGMDRTTRTTVAIVLGLVAANTLFNLVARAAGLPFPYTSFLLRPDDNFGDFFSLLINYPGGAIARVADGVGLHAIVPRDPPSLHAVVLPGHVAVTHLHMTPISTAVDLALLQAMRLIDPVVLFLAIESAFAAWWCAIALRIGPTRPARMAWIALGLLAYPTLLVFARGNIFAWATSLLLIEALLLGLARRAPVRCAVLLAIACNIRPNAILFAAPLLLFHWQTRWRFAVALGVAGLGLLIGCLLTATHFYPAYTLANIRAGLAAYYYQYAMDNWGLGYGSSLFGALKILAGGYRGWLNGTATAIALAIWAAGAIGYLAGRIAPPAFLFLTAAAYALGSTVFADYHLAIFLIVPIALALRDGSKATSREAIAERVMLVASCLVLAPKNYLFWVDIFSLQTLLNPLILLTAALFVLALAWRAAPSRQVEVHA